MQTQSAYIKTNGITIHFERTAGDKPPFLLCHGITDNGRCMLRLAEHLAPQYDVIMIDARGHGLSDAPDDGYSSDHHADDLFGLIKELNLKYPIIYGHSMGARTAVRFAAKYPDIQRAVILEDPVNIFPMNEEEKAASAKWLQQLPNEIQQRKTLSEAKRVEIAKQQNHADWTEAEQIEWAKSKSQVSPNVVKVGLSMGSIVDDLPMMTCPVLVLKADTDKETRRKNKAAIARIPKGKIIHVTGAGHNVRRDKWYDTIKYLDAFLDSL